MIDIRTMMREMNTGRPFKVTVITYSSNNRTGGDVRTFEAKVLKPKDVLGREPTATEKKLIAKEHRPYTRRVALLIDGYPVDQVRTIRMPLVLEFNGEEVRL